MAETRLKQKKRSWFRERFITLMIIPERTRRVHKLVVPFFAIRLSIIFFSLSLVFLLFVGVDYVRVLGKIAENKRLKGQNFKLREELQLIRNKVDTMEITMERVRNYTKKLQLLTGQGSKEGKKKKRTRSVTPPKSEKNRVPASVQELHSKLSVPKKQPRIETATQLRSRIEGVSLMGTALESNLAELQDFLFVRRALAMATPTLMPIPGYVSSGYGYRFHPYDGRRRLHRGVDIVAEPGTPVRAPAPGRITFSGYKVGYGKVVVIDHGFGIRTLYAHNSKLFVNRGARVRRCQIISQVGSTGMSTGPHLHYEVRKDGRPVNPSPFFTETC